MTPPMKPPSVRTPTPIVAAGVVRIDHAHKIAFLIHAIMLSLASGRPEAQLAHILELAGDQRLSVRLRNMAGGTEITTGGDVRQHLPITRHVVRDAYHRGSAVLCELTLVTGKATVGVDRQLVAFDGMRD